MMAIKPSMLRFGDTIGIVTLGSPLSPETIDNRIETLRNFGFEVILGDSVYASTGFLAGSPEMRAQDLMNMFANDDVKLILPTRGGVGVAGILPFLDYSFIQENPKLISGYSDITVLLNALFQLSNIITLHSLLLINFTENEPEYNLDQFYSATSILLPSRLIENPASIPQISRVPGNVTGPIVGGNLTSIISAFGTPFEIDTKGKILFLEETNEPINTVYRYLEMLKMAGKFDDCIGIVMGECSDCPIAYGTSYEDLINAFIIPLEKPLMTNVTTGHGLFKAAIPIGAIGNLNTINNSFTVIESTVKI